MPSEIEKTAVANLQRYLRTLYYFDDTLSPTPVDGIFDRATEEAVRRFQKTIRYISAKIRTALTYPAKDMSIFLCPRERGKSTEMTRR